MQQSNMTAESTKRPGRGGYRKGSGRKPKYPKLTKEEAGVLLNLLKIGLYGGQYPDLEKKLTILEANL